MYQSHKSGAGQVRAYAYLADHGTGEDFTASLRNALRNDELRVYYQPRHDIKEGNAAILEALVRWEKPGAGLLYPGFFIEAAIENGLIFALDLQVFEQCCRDLLWLREHHRANVRISVNITALECESLFHTQKLIAICESCGLALSDFEFEITESTYARDERKLKAFCDTFAGLGAGLSLDDFGTGQSPLTNLCRLPVDTIKIDRSMTQKACCPGRHEILVRHLVELAHEIGMRVVGEGIENERQFEHLKRLGCDQLQGYYISRPLPLQQLAPGLLRTPARPAC